MTAIEALEHYSSGHADTFEDLLDWPWLRFQKCYEAFLVRETIGRLDRQRDQMVAALYANSVYEEHKEADRNKVITSIEESFAHAVLVVRDDESVREEEFDEEDPFWAAVMRSKRDLDERFDSSGEDGSVRDVVDGERAARDLAAEMEIDQI